MSLRRATPVIRVFDVARARDFYVDFLGFSIDWEHRPAEDDPVYLQISKDECVLHLTERSFDSTPGTRIIIDTDAIDALFERLQESRFRRTRMGIDTTPTGNRFLCVTDPFGNLLTFFQDEK